MHLIKALILALPMLTRAVDLGHSAGGMQIREAAAGEVSLKDIYNSLEASDGLSWQDDGHGNEMAFVSLEAMAKAKRDIQEERMGKARRNVAEGGAAPGSGMQLAKRDGDNEVEDKDGNKHKAKWYCHSPGSLGFTTLRTVGAIMACRILEDYISSLNTGQWFWRSPPQADAAGAAAKRSVKGDNTQPSELQVRDGPLSRMVVGLNKHLAVAIRSGMCTAMLGWFVDQAACPDTGASKRGEGLVARSQGTVGGYVSIRTVKPGNWFGGDGEEIARLEAWAEKVE